MAEVRGAGGLALVVLFPIDRNNTSIEAREGSFEVLYLLSPNQKNAQLSTGPKSPETKAKTSLNAVKTGLTGRTVLLPTDDAALYEAHVARFLNRYKPTDDDERDLVQSLADTEWRLQRIPALEMGIFALGRIEFAELFPNEEPEMRKHLIEAKIHLVYERQLKNLSIQESRLRRQREKDEAGLRQSRDRRQQERQARLDRAALIVLDAASDRQVENFDFAQFGSEFSFDGEIYPRAVQIDIEREMAAKRLAKLKANAANIRTLETEAAA